ncbi:hypothetical protein [Demequina maris]|uniref:hypothetical protein n=1 Tax=Demequina maris TaxID=1638982 RepID=UPI000782C298|nr:hypothetical protein [Demequina maris]
MSENSDTNPWTDRVGPVYTADGAARALGVDVAALPRERMLELVTADGVTVYPIWQFVDGQVDPTVTEIVRILAPVAATAWSIAWWATGRRPLLDDHTVPEWLAGGGRSETVLVDARQTASHWAQ